MEVITNNVANADTTGYRKDFLVSHSFDEVLIRRIRDTNNSQVLGLTSAVGPLHLGTQRDQLFIDWDEGNLEPTNNSTDFALRGDVFFAVQTAEGERYTRNGSFYLDNEGFLVDGEGNYLLGNNGPINVGTLNFTVDQFGGVRVGEEMIDTIRVVSFPDNNALRKQGSSLFYSIEAPLDVPNPYVIMQGVIESSNVDIGRSMVDMLAMFRAYETNQRMITMIDETVGRAVTDIGRLR